MNILITGANGYIGKSLYNAFKQTYKVNAITRTEYDLTDHTYLRRLFRGDYYDVVLHCAVSGGDRLQTDNWEVMDANLRMYYNLLDYKASYGKLIHFGSGAELHASETPYGLSKKVIANSISEIANFYNIRIFGLFDENEMDTRFIKSNIKRYINKEPMIIHQNKHMDFFYMKDLISLVQHHINSETSTLIKESNCSYVKSYSLLDIAHMINELDSHTSPILLDTIPGNSYISKFNAPYAIDYIGLKQGIVETYNKLKNGY